MKISTGFLASAAIVFAVAAACSAPASAAFPDKPIHLVSPYPPGGGNDTMARALAKKITEDLKVSVIVDNKPGANGIIATEYVQRADPDGYTLLMANVGSHGINPALYKNVKYDAYKDFTPISLVATSPNVLVVPATLGVKNLKEFVAYAQQHPGKVTYGSNGTGSTQHLSGAMFASAFKLDMLHVPYKGTGPMTTDLLGGRLTASFGNIIAVLPHIKSGQLVALAVTTPQRSEALPDVPTVAETLPGFSAVVWWAIVGPKGIPADRVRILNEEVRKFDDDPETKKMLAALGAQPEADSSKQLGDYIKAEVAKWAQVVKESGATAE
jgi:tripartite-type tricarboxylate transporter receptor subunit TctC